MPHRVKKENGYCRRKTHMDTELLSCLIEIRKEIQKIKYSKDDNDIVKCNRLNKNLNFMRHHLHYYREFDAIDNLELLGESYIKKMKRELTPMVFLTSILNKRITKLVDGFYANIDAKLHYYDAYNNSYLNNIRTNHGSLDLNAVSTYSYLQDSDIDSNQPLIDLPWTIMLILTGLLLDRLLAMK